jgi:hypothetical protein
MHKSYEENSSLGIIRCDECAGKDPLFTQWFSIYTALKIVGCSAFCSYNEIVIISHAHSVAILLFVLDYFNRHSS